MLAILKAEEVMDWSAAEEDAVAVAAEDSLDDVGDLVEVQENVTAFLLAALEEQKVEDQQMASYRPACR